MAVGERGALVSARWLAGCAVSLAVAGCASQPPGLPANWSPTSQCLAVSEVTTMSLARPPSAKPALDIVNGVATGRVVVGGGEYGPYKFVTAQLSPSDWALVRQESCAEAVRYGTGKADVNDPGPAKVGGQVFVTVHSALGTTGVSLESESGDADPLIGQLRALARRYFGDATF